MSIPEVSTSCSKGKETGTRTDTMREAPHNSSVKRPHPQTNEKLSSRGGIQAGRDTITRPLLTFLEDVCDLLEQAPLEHVGRSGSKVHLATWQAHEVGRTRGSRRAGGVVVRKELVGLEVGPVKGEATGQGRPTGDL